ARKIVQVNNKGITEEDPIYFEDIPLGNKVVEASPYTSLFTTINLYELISEDETQIKQDTTCTLTIDKDHYLDVNSNTLKLWSDLFPTSVDIRSDIDEGHEFNIYARITSSGIPYIRLRFEFDCGGDKLEAYSDVYYMETGS
ncbi:hypothetical protein N7I24_004934, partial [Vibrio alginolyticus]|nr:hypothetical protein [Vibrio alginolyticus]